MRKFCLTVALAALVCVPALAQFRGMGGDMSATLLANEGVQKELKLTADQKAAIAKASKEMSDARRKAFEDKDFSAFGTVMQDYNKAMTKVKGDLTSAQKKRLLGIEAQLAEKNKTVAIFKNADVVTALSLTDKQKEIVSEYEKDAKELFEDAKGDRSKFREVMQKVQKLGGETYAKLTKSLSEKQQAAWKELKGDKFNVVLPKGGFNPKGKDRPKKTDDN